MVPVNNRGFTPHEEHEATEIEFGDNVHSIKRFSRVQMATSPTSYQKHRTEQREEWKGTKIERSMKIEKNTSLVLGRSKRPWGRDHRRKMRTT